MTLTEPVKSAILDHANQELPRECCGVVIIRKGKQAYFPCRNLAVGSDNFILSPEDYSRADDEGDIVAVIHSHPNMSAKPSQADLVACEASGLPWFIVGLPSQVWEYIEPSGYVAPLVGRVWSHGVLDCYSIIRDYYKMERGISLFDFDRSDDWWNRGQNLYMDNFKSQNFVQVSEADLQKDDCILMCIKSPVPNHGAVYLGNGVILHHVHGRLSTRDVFGGYWLKNTAGYFRYADNSASG